MSDDLQPRAASSMSQPDQLELIRIALNLMGQELGRFDDRLARLEVALNVWMQAQNDQSALLEKRAKHIEEKLDEVVIAVDLLGKGLLKDWDSA